MCVPTEKSALRLGNTGLHNWRAWEWRSHTFPPTSEAAEVVTTYYLVWIPGFMVYQKIWQGAHCSLKVCDFSVFQSPEVWKSTWSSIDDRQFLGSRLICNSNFTCFFELSQHMLTDKCIAEVCIRVVYFYGHWTPAGMLLISCPVVYVLVQIADQW